MVFYLILTAATVMPVPGAAEGLDESAVTVTVLVLSPPLFQPLPAGRLNKPVALS